MRMYNKRKKKEKSESKERNLIRRYSGTQSFILLSFPDENKKNLILLVRKDLGSYQKREYNMTPFTRNFLQL